jgi:hypothetical protein
MSDLLDLKLKIPCPSNDCCTLVACNDAWAFSFYYFYSRRSGRLPHAGWEGNA